MKTNEVAVTKLEKLGLKRLLKKSGRRFEEQHAQIRSEVFAWACGALCETDNDDYPPMTEAGVEQWLTGSPVFFEEYKGEALVSL